MRRVEGGCRAKVVKNKCAAPFGEARFALGEPASAVSLAIGAGGAAAVDLGVEYTEYGGKAWR